MFCAKFMIEQIDYNLPSLQELKEKQRFYFNTQQVISEHAKLTCFKYSGIQKKKKTLLSYHLKKRKLYLIRDILTLIRQRSGNFKIIRIIVFNCGKITATRE